MKELGQVAYEAYVESTGGVSAVSGQPLPAWGDQAAPILQAWRAAASAVILAHQRAPLPPPAITVVTYEQPPTGGLR